MRRRGFLGAVLGGAVGLVCRNRQQKTPDLEVIAEHMERDLSEYPTLHAVGIGRTPAEALAMAERVHKRCFPQVAISWTSAPALKFEGVWEVRVA